MADADDLGYEENEMQIEPPIEVDASQIDAPVPERGMVPIEGVRFDWMPSLEKQYGDLKINKASWRTLVNMIYPSARTFDSVLMVLSYCKARNLDVWKRPVHIVPMWNSALRQEVETVWPGIAELRTTAARTGQYAGMDEASFGPMQEKTFKGKTRRDGKMIDAEITVKFPLWCRITVIRMLSGQPCKYVGPKVYWEETYATVGKSELPNRMWQERPIGQLEKCAEAAALRRAFPEEVGSDYASDEMMGRTVSADGMDSVRTREEPNGPPVNALATKEVAPEPPPRRRRTSGPRGTHVLETAHREAEAAERPAPPSIEQQFKEAADASRTTQELVQAGQAYRDRRQELLQGSAEDQASAQRMVDYYQQRAAELNESVEDARQAKAAAPKPQETLPLEPAPTVEAPVQPQEAAPPPQEAPAEAQEAPSEQPLPQYQPAQESAPAPAQAPPAPWPEDIEELVMKSGNSIEVRAMITELWAGESVEDVEFRFLTMRDRHTALPTPAQKIALTRARNLIEERFR